MAMRRSYAVYNDFCSKSVIVVRVEFFKTAHSPAVQTTAMHYLRSQRRAHHFIEKTFFKYIALSAVLVNCYHYFVLLFL